MTRAAHRRRASGLGKRLGVATLSIALLLCGGALAGALATPAAALSGTALINGATVTGSPSVEQTIAESLGLHVTVVSASTWAAMKTADFSKYTVLIIGDPTCKALAPSVTANRATWTSAVMATAGGNTAVGNRVVLGADPVRAHTPGAGETIRAGIAFAAALSPPTGHATGVYFDASCDGHGGENAALVDTLNRLSVDTMRPWAENASPPCGSQISVIGTAPQFAGVTADSLEGWQCSVRETFPSFETDFVPLAITLDSSKPATCGTDTATSMATCGEPYLLAAGPGLVSATPDITVTVSNPIGTAHAVTAMLTDGNTGAPLAGQLVSFTVNGTNAGAPGNCVPDGCVSNGAGSVTFVYSGHPGNDTIVVSILCAGTIQTATATATTPPPPPPGITLAPPTGSSVIGTEHTVTASVTKPGVGPLVGQLVTFTVAGVNGGVMGTCGPLSCRTDGAGNVTFTYSGTDVGIDMISASTTANGATQTATVEMTWTNPPAPALTLQLKVGLSEVNTTHTVTATVTSGGQLIADQLVKFTVSGVNSGAAGTCAPVGCKTNSAGQVAFTYVGVHVGHDTITAHVTRGGSVLTDTAAMTWIARAKNSPNIFQVELRSCNSLHVGYNNFPADTVVHWNVAQQGNVVATKQFRALGSGSAKHFLTQPLGVRLKPGHDGLVHFEWSVQSTNFSYTAARRPGC